MKGNKAYLVEDNLSYNNVGQTTVSGGYFIVKGANINSKAKIEVEFISTDKKEYKNYNYLNAHFNITEDPKGLKYTFKASVQVIQGKLSGMAKTNEQNSIHEIPITQFDTLRENILKAGKTQFTVEASTNDLTLATLDRDNVS